MARIGSLTARVGKLSPRVAAMPKKAEDFYHSKEWRALVARRKRDSDYFEALGRARHGERLILDHVVERKDGGADLDPGNTQWLTFGEHQAKTAREKARRATGGGGRKSGEAGAR